MIKMTLLITRKPGTTLDQLRDYWVNKHLPIVQSIAEVQRYSRRYVQQFNTYSSPNHTAAAPFDGIVEAWFDSLDDALALTTSDNWVNIIKKDDLNFPRCHEDADDAV